MSQSPGWYYAQGDPPGTMRYWDGNQWVGEPTAETPSSPFSSPSAPPPPPPNLAANVGPDGLVFGGAGERLGARLIDGLIFGIPAGIAAFFLFDFDDLVELSSSLSFVLWVTALGFAYEIGFIALKGATPGKAIVGLTVVDADRNSPPGWGPATLRAAPALLGLLPAIGGLINLAIGIGSGVMISNDAQNQSVYDKAGSTYVIKNR